MGAREHTATVFIGARSRARIALRGVCFSVVGGCQVSLTPGAHDCTRAPCTQRAAHTSLLRRSMQRLSLGRMPGPTLAMRCRIVYEHRAHSAQRTPVCCAAACNPSVLGGCLPERSALCAHMCCWSRMRTPGRLTWSAGPSGRAGSMSTGKTCPVHKTCPLNWSPAVPPAPRHRPLGQTTWSFHHRGMCIRPSRYR